MLSANPLLHTRSLRDSVRDVRSLFLHYLTDKQRRSYCASRIILSMSSCFSISPMFPLVGFFRLLLQEQYTKSHDDTAAGHPRTLPLTWRNECSVQALSLNISVCMYEKQYDKVKKKKKTIWGSHRLTYSGTLPKNSQKPKK